MTHLCERVHLPSHTHTRPHPLTEVNIVVAAPLAVHLVDEEAGDGLKQQAEDGHAHAEAEGVPSTVRQVVRQRVEDPKVDDVQQHGHHHPQQKLCSWEMNTQHSGGENKHAYTQHRARGNSGCQPKYTTFNDQIQFCPNKLLMQEKSEIAVHHYDVIWEPIIYDIRTLQGPPKLQMKNRVILPILQSSPVHFRWASYSLNSSKVGRLLVYRAERITGALYCNTGLKKLNYSFWIFCWKCHDAVQLRYLGCISQSSPIMNDSGFKNHNFFFSRIIIICSLYALSPGENQQATFNARVLLAPPWGGCSSWAAHHQHCVDRVPLNNGPNGEG